MTPFNPALPREIEFREQTLMYACRYVKTCVCVKVNFWFNLRFKSEGPWCHKRILLICHFLVEPSPTTSRFFWFRAALVELQRVCIKVFDQRPPCVPGILSICYFIVELSPEIAHIQAFDVRKVCNEVKLSISRQTNRVHPTVLVHHWDLDLEIVALDSLFELLSDVFVLVCHVRFWNYGQ